MFTASSKQRPNVVDLNLQPILNATEIYSGMYANVGVTFFAYNAPQNKGIGVGLENVQKVADGEPLGGGRAAVEDDFQAVAPAIPAQPYGSVADIPATPVYPQPDPAYYPPAPAYPQQPQQY